MNELITVNMNDDGEVVVSGRELHKGLEVSSNYTTWMNRMIDYGFVENTDYIAMFQKRKTAQGNETTYTDHVLKLDMAKEIAMIQRSEIGKKVRGYFIQVEKDYNSPEKIMARALKIAEDKIGNLLTVKEAQDKEIKMLKPKADYTDRVLDSKELLTTTQIAKDFGLSAKTFNNILHLYRIQYKVNKQWVLYAKYQGKGYTHSKTLDLRNVNGTDKVVNETAWTLKGRKFLHDFLADKGIYTTLAKKGDVQ